MQAATEARLLLPQIFAIAVGLCLSVLLGGLAATSSMDSISPKEKYFIANLLQVPKSLDDGLTISLLSAR